MKIMKAEMRTTIRDLTDYRTERLTVVGYAGYKIVTTRTTGKKKPQHYWDCVCTCGNRVTKSTPALLYQKVKSCGCQKSEITAARNRRHGMMNTPEYQSWRGMKERCTNPNHNRWDIYGGKGIKVCDRWIDNLPAFVEDMGPRPEGMSLDRIDSNGNYCPENCRWADATTQAFNTCTTRQITFKGETLSLYRMADKYGQGEATVRYRLNQGWSVEDALTIKAGDQRIFDKHSRRIEYDGETLSITKHAEKQGISINTVRGRIRRGFSLERVFAPVKKRKKRSTSPSPDLVSTNIR